MRPPSPGTARAPRARDGRRVLRRCRAPGQAAPLHLRRPFSVDGTLLHDNPAPPCGRRTRAPSPGRRPSHPPAGRNIEVQWPGEKRSNETRVSTTDPETRCITSATTPPSGCATGCADGAPPRTHRRRRTHHPPKGAEGVTALEMNARFPRPPSAAPSLGARGTTPGRSSPPTHAATRSISHAANTISGSPHTSPTTPSASHWRSTPARRTHRSRHQHAGPRTARSTLRLAQDYRQRTRTESGWREETQGCRAP